MEKLPEFIANHSLLVALFIGLGLALLITEIRRLKRGGSGLSPVGFTLLMNRSTPTVLDVRDAEAFAAKHIVGAQYVGDDVTAKHPAIAKAQKRDKAIALYCANGQTAPNVARKLQATGVTNVFYLKGGLDAWLSENLPVTTN